MKIAVVTDKTTAWKHATLWLDVDQRALSAIGTCSWRTNSFVQGVNIVTASAQVAIYPLRQEHLTPAIEAVSQALLDHGLQPERGPMSTYVVGEGAVVFAALQDAFAKASGMGHVVLTVTVSNACPIPD